MPEPTWPSGEPREVEQGDSTQEVDFVGTVQDLLEDEIDRVAPLFRASGGDVRNEALRLAIEMHNKTDLKWDIKRVTPEIVSIWVKKWRERRADARELAEIGKKIDAVGAVVKADERIARFVAEEVPRLVGNFSHAKFYSATFDSALYRAVDGDPERVATLTEDDFRKAAMEAIR